MHPTPQPLLVSFDSWHGNAPTQPSRWNGTPFSFDMPNAVSFLAHMHELIENLVKLQAVELERNRIAQETRALPTQLADAHASLKAAELQAAQASDALSREESLRTRLERDIASHRQKSARFRTQLDSVKTPEQAQAIEHEIQFATSEAERLESEEFASLERTEAQEAALAQIRANVETQSTAFDKTRARLAITQQELAAELTALNAQREALRPLIEPEWLTRFDRISTSRGSGLARVDNQQCVGCRMGVRPQMWNQLREGQLLVCDSCGRILYWDPAMAPAPKAPQPAPVPGAGRAPRKSHPAES